MRQRKRDTRPFDTQIEVWIPRRQAWVGFDCSRETEPAAIERDFASGYPFYARTRRWRAMRDGQVILTHEPEGKE